MSQKKSMSGFHKGIDSTPASPDHVLFFLTNSYCCSFNFVAVCRLVAKNMCPITHFGAQQCC